MLKTSDIHDFIAWYSSAGDEGRNMYVRLCCACNCRCRSSCSVELLSCRRNEKNGAGAEPDPTAIALLVFGVHLLEAFLFRISDDRSKGDAE